MISVVVIKEKDVDYLLDQYKLKQVIISTTINKRVYVTIRNALSRTNLLILRDITTDQIPYIKMRINNMEKPKLLRLEKVALILQKSN